MCVVPALFFPPLRPDGSHSGTGITAVQSSAAGSEAEIQTALTQASLGPTTAMQATSSLLALPPGATRRCLAATGRHAAAVAAAAAARTALMTARSVAARRPCCICWWAVTARRRRQCTHLVGRLRLSLMPCCKTTPRSVAEADPSVPLVAAALPEVGILCPLRRWPRLLGLGCSCRLPPSG